MVVKIGKYVTISTKVPKKLKEDAEKLDIKLSEFLRKALEEEVRRRKIIRLENELKKIKDALDKISIHDFIRLIREDRNSR